MAKIFKPKAFLESPLAVIAPGMLGAAVGFLLMTVLTNDSSGGAPTSADFIGQPQYQLWRILIVAQTALFGGALYPLYRRLRALLSKIDTDGHWGYMAGALVMLICAYFLPYMISPVGELPLSHHSKRMFIMLLLAGGTALSAVFGLMLLYLRFRQLDVNKQTVFDGPAIDDYVAARSEVTWMMSILGTMIGLGTLATGGLSDTIRAAYEATGTSNPPLSVHEVIAYGAYLTVILATVYVPVHAMQRAAGTKIRDCILQNDASAGSGPLDRERLRKEIEDMLQLGVNARESLQGNLAVLAPLLAALLSGLLKLE